MLVLAGAGTGKTRVLTTRIAHILATGRACPSQILAVTFTNKAAREMKQRIGMLIGGAVEGMPWLGTFHSIGVKLLRRHAELAGLKADFTILDTDDQVRLMKQMIQAEGIDEKRWPARQLRQMIDGWKNRGLAPEGCSRGRRPRLRQRQGPAALRGLPGPAEDAERRRLRRPAAGADPHLPRASGRARGLSPQFRYILVDEYQDTNVAQYLWLRLLAQRPSSPPQDSRQTAEGRNRPVRRPAGPLRRRRTPGANA